MAVTPGSINLSQYVSGFNFTMVLIVFGGIVSLLLIGLILWYVLEKKKYFIPCVILERHSNGERLRIINAKEIKQTDQSIVVLWTGFGNVISPLRRIEIPINTTDHKRPYGDGYAYMFYKTIEGDYFPLKTNVTLFDEVEVKEVLEKRKLDINGVQMYDDKGLPIFDLVVQTRRVPRIELLTIPSDLRLWIGQKCKTNSEMSKKSGFWETYGAYIILGGSVAIAFIILALAMKNATELITQTIDKTMFFAEKIDKLIAAAGVGVPQNVPVPAP